MATRLYLKNATVSGTVPTSYKGAWDDTNNNSRPLALVQSGISPSSFGNTFGSGTDRDVAMVRFISDVIPDARTISGTLSWCLNVREGNELVNAYTHVHAWVSNGGTNTVRGTLLTDSIGATEWGTSYGGRAESSVALSSVNAEAGDRIIIEVGFRYTLASNTYQNVLKYGGTGTDATEDTDGISWFEFSQDGLLADYVFGAVDFTESDTLEVTGSADPQVSFTDADTLYVRARLPIPHIGNGSALTGCVTTPTGVSVPSTSPLNAKWSVKGGPLSAELQATQRDDLLLSEVRLFDESGLGWHGWVWDAPKGNTLTALGSAAPLSMTKNRSLYCDTEQFSWEQSPWYDPQDPLYQPAPQWTWGGGSLRGVWLPGESYATQSRIEVISKLPKSQFTDFIISFDWARNHTSSSIRLLAEVPDESSVYGYTYTTVAEVSGAGDLTGTYVGAINVAGMTRLVCQMYGFTNASPMVDGYSMRVWDMKLYGEGITTIRPDTVLTNCVGNLPTWAFPSGSNWLSWIEESSVSVEPFTPEWKSDAEVVQEVVTYDDMDYYWAARFVGMEQRFVPVYTDRETAASLSVDLTKVAYDFTESDMESMASRVLVRYHDSDGRSKSLFRTDTDESHYLVRVERVMDAEISADTSSDSLAQSLGDLALAELGASTARGTVSTGYLRTAHGAAVPLSEALSGRLVDLGERVSRISSVERRGAQVNLSLDSEPYRLATTLARMSKRGY